MSDITLEQEVKLLRALHDNRIFFLNKIGDIEKTPDCYDLMYQFMKEWGASDGLIMLEYFSEEELKVVFCSERTHNKAHLMLVKDD